MNAPCPRCKAEIHQVRELARRCPRCMETFHARCAKDGDACSVCARVFKPLVLAPAIVDPPRSFWSGTNKSRGVWVPLF